MLSTNVSFNVHIIINYNGGGDKGHSPRRHVKWIILDDAHKCVCVSCERGRRNRQPVYKI